MKPPLRVAASLFLYLVAVFYLVTPAFSEKSTPPPLPSSHFLYQLTGFIFSPGYRLHICFLHVSNTFKNVMEYNFKVNVLFNIDFRANVVDIAIGATEQGLLF